MGLWITTCQSARGPDADVRDKRLNYLTLVGSYFGAYSHSDLDREVKWHTKYGRQNGIHVSPTFMIDGLVQADMTSGDPVTSWVSRLLKH